MITTLAIFGLVVNHTIFDLHLSDGEVALEVGRIILCIPQAEFKKGICGKMRSSGPMIGDVELPDFKALAHRNKIARARLNPFVCRADYAVAHAVPAGVVLELRARGLPRRRPELPALVVSHVDVSPTDVGGYVVIAVAGQPAETCISVEGVPACGVRNDAEVGFASEVVNPW